MIGLLLLLSCSLLGAHFIDECANLSGSSFNLSKRAACKREISSPGVDFDAVEFNNAIQWLARAMQ